MSIHEDDPGRGRSRRDVIHGAAALGLGAVTLPSLLAACSGDDKTGAVQSPSSHATTDAGAESTPSPESSSRVQNGSAGSSGVSLAPLTSGVYYPKPYVGPRARQTKPFGDNKTVFTVVVPEDTSVVGDWNANQMTKWFEKRTGVKVKFHTVSTANNDMTKVNAMIASGDLPDAFMGIPFTRDQISLYGQQGVFAKLDEHIAKLAPQLRDAYHGYPDLASLAKATDGNTYAFPSLNDCYHCHVSPSRAWVNKNFVEAGGGKIPETTEQLRAFLKALKANDADGHGDTVPLAAGVNNPIDRFFMNAFLYNPGEPWLALDGNKVDFVANKPQWRQALKYLRSLFDDGTLSPQVFTMTDEALQKLGNNPHYDRIGVARCYYWGSFMDAGTAEPDSRWRRYVPVPPLKGPDGVHYAAWDYYSPYILNSVVITKACEHPDVLVRWADYQMELEATLIAYNGIEGKSWGWAKKGDRSIQRRQAVWRQSVWPAPAGQSWDQYSAMYRSNDFRLGQQTDQKNSAVPAQLYYDSKVYAKHKQPKELQLPPLIFDEATAASNADIALALKNHVTQSMAQFATGKLDIDDDNVWKTYVGKIDQMNLALYLKNYQKAYDSRPTG